MKKKARITFSIAIILLFFPVFTDNCPVFAESNSLGGTGKITIEEGETGIFDPENPEMIVDPGESPNTVGDLRIDYVPQLNFTGENKISTKDEVYQVNAQLFKDDTPARGNFIQISDYRSSAFGWTLQIKQEHQFRNTKTSNSQLSGAYLSLDQSWTNSLMDDKYAPVVSKEVVHLTNIGETYNLAEAKPGTGMGTWLISFGASEQNPKDRENTLLPRTDRQGKKMLDSNFNNQLMYENSALTLTVPGSIPKDSVNYSTVITWILSELP